MREERPYYFSREELWSVKGVFVESREFDWQNFQERQKSGDSKSPQSARRIKM